MSLTISIDSSRIGNAEAVTKALLSVEINRAMAQGVSQRIKRHLIGLSSSRWSARPEGSVPTQFYAKASRATHVFSAEQTGFSVGVDQIGMRQRLMGGPIDPVNRKVLTIPADGAAYGHRAGEFDNLQLAWRVVDGKAKCIGLESTDGTKGRERILTGSGRWRTVSRASLGNRLMFRFIRHADQKGDPTVLPTPDEMKQAAVDAAGQYLKAIKARRAK